MSVRLRDDAFLDRCERARLVFEAVQLVAALKEAAAQGDEALEARAALLELPRQLSLIGFFAAQSQTSPLADALRAISVARRAGNLPAVLQDQTLGLTGALAAVRELYKWRDALRARLP